MMIFPAVCKPGDGMKFKILSSSYIYGFRSYSPRHRYVNPFRPGTHDFNEFERGYFQAQKRAGL